MISKGGVAFDVQIAYDVEINHEEEIEMDWTCLEAKGWRQIKNSSLLSHGGRRSNMDEASLGGLQTIGDQLQGDESNRQKTLKMQEN